MEKRAIIKRIYHSDCTIGTINFGNNRYFTLELPWQDNKTDVSCIPPGLYKAQYRNSPSNGDVIELKDVPKRTYIQIHAGNYTRQILGCILVGDSLKDINTDGIIDVTNSNNTLQKLLTWAGKDEFLLEVE